MLDMLRVLNKKVPFFIKHPIKSHNYKKIINNKFSKAQDNNLKHLYQNQDDLHWRKAFYKLWCTNQNTHEILNAFTENRIDLINGHSQNNEGPILVTVVKNEIKRIQTFLNHYRSIGFQRFVILDNNSNDGTHEWLCNQPDCDVFCTEEPYSTHKREGWINRLLSHYGFNQWYLVVDSDEHFVYPGIEQEDINYFISLIKDKGYERIRSVMLDMYPKDNIILDKKENSENEDYVAEYSYFDKTNYKVLEVHEGLMVSGGPRERIFNLKVCLTKHPLFYFRKGDIQGHSHFPYPYKKNKSLPCFSALLHYKFLNSDLNKYKQRVEEGNFYNGSEEYKQYLQLFGDNKDNFTFFYQGSAKYENSKSLLQVEIIEEIK
ncbi:glycosyltransferase family 2 protein [Bacillus wiedmannii]|uniref:Glycosyltransferase family 2 protein n=1 Tax=Bacillus wiedmannii TaxID=1890302 RepID=A0ABX5DVA9_9BACI|nr:glycosyltransferase family 2 protein [Bacillus wiedmannii]PRT03972.1 hypothetical protein C6356_20950 [Bacillus wiedmannii]PRT38981.1 hypothetical protein C6357_18695 [Bacillus wiedmannii]